jgi:sporulation protein YlmC with PRC-barrel domain
MLSGHVARNAAALVAGLALSCTALAQLAYDREPELWPLDRVIGTPVQSARGEVLGSIKDLIVDTSSGEIEYVVVARRAGERPAVYPVGALAAGDRGEVLVDGAPVAIDLEASGAAGASTLVPTQRRQFAFAAADLGRREELVVNLVEGTVGFARK